MAPGSSNVIGPDGMLSGQFLAGLGDKIPVELERLPDPRTPEKEDGVISPSELERYPPVYEQLIEGTRSLLSEISRRAGDEIGKTKSRPIIFSLEIIAEIFGHTRTRLDKALLGIRQKTSLEDIKWYWKKVRVVWLGGVVLKAVWDEIFGPREEASSSSNGGGGGGNGRSNGLVGSLRDFFRERRRERNLRAKMLRLWLPIMVIGDSALEILDYAKDLIPESEYWRLVTLG